MLLLLMLPTENDVLFIVCYMFYMSRPLSMLMDHTPRDYQTYISSITMFSGLINYTVIFLVGLINEYAGFRIVLLR